MRGGNQVNLIDYYFSLYPMSISEVSLLILTKVYPASDDFKKIIESTLNEFNRLKKIENKNHNYSLNVQMISNKTIEPFTKFFEQAVGNLTPTLKKRITKIPLKKHIQRYFELLFSLYSNKDSFSEFYKRELGIPSPKAYLTLMGNTIYPNVGNYLVRNLKLAKENNSNLKTFEQAITKDIANGSNEFKRKVLKTIETKGVIVMPFRVGPLNIVNKKRGINLYIWKIPPMLREYPAELIYKYYFFLTPQEHFSANPEIVTTFETAKGIYFFNMLGYAKDISSYISYFDKSLLLKNLIIASAYWVVYNKYNDYFHFLFPNELFDLVKKFVNSFNPNITKRFDKELMKIERVFKVYKELLLSKKYYKLRNLIAEKDLLMVLSGFDYNFVKLINKLLMLNKQDEQITKFGDSKNGK